MKKAIFVILVLLIVYVLLVNAMRSEILYPAGKDTVESFGDGTYQILSSQTAEDLSEESLYNCKYNVVIIPQVERFQIANGKGYVIGKSTGHYTYDGNDIECTYKHYAVIEIKTNRLTLCIVPENSSGVDAGLDVYSRLLDGMIQNGDAQMLGQLTDFSKENQSFFEGFG